MSGQIRTLNEVSLADQAYEMIRNAILEGELKPEERFTIEKMASQLGISRTPVREALKALENDGYLRLLPHRGAMVETYAFDEMGHRYHIAAMLEGYAAEQACMNRNDELLATLRRNCEKLDRLCEKPSFSAQDVRKAHELNQEFHGAIREASGSQTLTRLMATLRQPTSYSMRYWGSNEGRAASVKIHREIFEAFERGDCLAARALAEKHLTDAFRDITVSFFENIVPDNPE